MTTPVTTDQASSCPSPGEPPDPPPPALPVLEPNSTPPPCHALPGGSSAQSKTQPPTLATEQPSNSPAHLPVPANRPSFHDILKNTQSPPRRAEDLLASNSMVLTHEDGNRLLPTFTCSEALKEELAHPWKEALIAKPLGRNVAFGTFEKRVREIWKPNDEMEVMPLGSRYFLIKFDNAMDREKVLLEGPWMVQDLAVHHHFN